MRRGEIWWAALRPPIGSEPGHRRPVLVVQDDEFNDSHIGTCVCAVITSNTKLAEAPGNVLLPRRESHLKKQSVVNVSQIVTVDKRFLEARVVALPHGRMAEIDAGLRLVLSL